MLKRLYTFELIGFAVVSALGTLCHFVYEWSGYSVLVAPFVSVNESSWEHLKLLFFPFLLWSFIEAVVFAREYKILPAKLIGVLTGMATILAVFYTYHGITGKNIDAINIISFFIGVAASFFTSYTLVKNNRLQTKKALIISIIGFLILIILFVLFTFAPPFLPLFKDPVSQSYGV